MDKLYLSHPLLTINCTSPKNDQILSNFCLVDLWEKNINSSYRLSDSIFLTNFACRRKAFVLCFVSSDYYAKKMLPCFFISIKQGKNGISAFHVQVSMIIQKKASLALDHTVFFLGNEISFQNNRFASFSETMLLFFPQRPIYGRPNSKERDLWIHYCYKTI